MNEPSWKILVDVGDGTRVGIDAWLAVAEPRVSGPVRPGQTLSQTWLQDAIPLAHTLPAFVIARAMQRVRHGPRAAAPRRAAVVCLCRG